MGSIPEVFLDSTESMPLLGMGTAVYPLGAEAMKSAIVHAIQLGYRHFDTASPYLSEQQLSQAIAEAQSFELIKSRKELFITSKLWCTEAHPDLVLPALQKTLQNLQLEYLDLYLIHWPVSSKPGEYIWPIKKEDLLPMDFKSMWESMEACHKFGITKFIRVSNFSCKKLEELLAVAKIPPAVNQMNPLWQQKKLRDFCKAKGIHVTAYSPLGATGTFWGTSRVIECEVLKETAKARGKTVAQMVSLYRVEDMQPSMSPMNFSKLLKGLEGGNRTCISATSNLESTTSNFSSIDKFSDI